MVRTKFRLWVEDTRNELEKLYITTEYIKHKSTDESLIPGPSTGIIQRISKLLRTSNCMGIATNGI